MKKKKRSSAVRVVFFCSFPLEGIEQLIPVWQLDEDETDAGAQTSNHRGDPPELCIWLVAGDQDRDQNHDEDEDRQDEGQVVHDIRSERHDDG